MGLLDGSFDMDGYVRKRLMEMDNLANRELFKEIIADMLGGLHRHIEEEYRLLQDRVFKEVPLAERMPNIVTGIASLDEYDVTDKFLHPMDSADLEAGQVDVGEMLTSLKAGKPFYLYTCFITEDYCELQKLIAEERVFHGLIESDYGETSADFIIKPNERYLKKLAELYPMARLNQLPWRSVNAPYLYKLFDVYVTNLEGLAELEAEGQPKKITVEFEEYAEKVRYNMVPLWNLMPTSITANAYPQPALERGYFEHVLYESQFRPEYAYILRHSQWVLRSLRRLQGDFYILCDGEDPGVWDFYEVHPVPDKIHYEYPPMSNAQYESFSQNMMEHYGQRIKTRTELNRYFESFPCGRYFELMSAKVVNNEGRKETYSMEDFAEYEFRSGNWDKALEVSLRPKDQDFFLNRDIMSFLVTGLQHFFPEYECRGKLV